MRPREILEKRGIAKVADFAGWKENSADYWIYPIFAPDGSIIAHRMKRFPDSQAKAKYLWQGEKPKDDNAQWYILPGTLDAIAAAGGVAYLANGEPALLAYHAAGIRNVIATTLSEVAFPKNGVAYLKALGIVRLLYPVDNDKAGLKSAGNWRDSLAGSGIDYAPLQWPANMPEKADANDVLIHVQGNAASFQDILENGLRELALPAPEPKAPKTPAAEIDFSGIHATLLEQVHSALSAQGRFTGHRYGSWLQIRCLYHEDKQASAGFDPQTGVIHCFGCGAKESITKNAEALNIQWRDLLPKSEKKPRKAQSSTEAKETPKKGKKADFSDFYAERIQLAAGNPDKRDLEQIIADDIMARGLAYESGQFVGFGNWKALPLAVLSAVLTLCEGKSKAALFLGRVHDALVAGRLASAFTLHECAIAINNTYDFVFDGVFELERMGFLTIVRSISSIDSIAHKVSSNNPQGGRPQNWVLAQLDESEIVCQLLKMLEIYYLEKHCPKAIALPTEQMARQLGLDRKQLLEWRERAKAALDDPANKAAKRAYDAEFLGNGGNWKGWHKAFESKISVPLNYGKIADSHKLRADLLAWWVKCVRDTNSRQELCRLLGCTDPVIDKLLITANLASEKQTTRVEIEKLPSTVKGMAIAYNKAQRDLQGHAWRGGFWDMQDKAWVPFEGYTDCMETYSKLAGRISKAFLLVQTPSKHRPMTEEEIQKRDEERAAKAEEKAMAGHVSAVAKPKTEAAQADASQTESPKQSYVYTKWDKHSYEFLYRQLQLLVHCFTPYALQGHCIVDKAGKALHAGQLASLMDWFLENASEKQTRKVKSFYGKGYDEDLDLAALQKLADERRALLGEVEGHGFEDDVANLPIFADMPQQTALILAPAATPVTPAKVIPAPECDDVNPYKREAVNIVANPNMTLEYVMGLGRRDKKEQVNRFEKVGR